MYVGHLNSGTDSFTYTDTLMNFPLLAGMKCFDMASQTLYVGAIDAIYSLNASTGRYVDTFASQIPLNCLVFSPKTKKMIAIHQEFSSTSVYSIEISTKTTTFLNTINTVDYISDQPTLDTDNSIIYIGTNLGLNKINATTGAFIEKITLNSPLSSFVYHAPSKKIYGLGWDGQQQTFCSFDPATKVLSTIAAVPSITGYSSSGCIDFAGSRYLVQTNLGITFIDLNTGQISKSIPKPTTSLFEYLNHSTIPLGMAKEIQEPLTLYPNPSSHYIHAQGIETGSPFQIWDIKGVLIMTGNLEEEGINIETLPFGLYQLRFAEGKTYRFNRK